MIRLTPLAKSCKDLWLLTKRIQYPYVSLMTKKWDYDGNRWLFSVVDVIAVLTDSKNPRNYWKVLKHRLTKAGNELVTNCNRLKKVANIQIVYQPEIVVYTIKIY